MQSPSKNITLQFPSPYQYFPFFFFILGTIALIITPNNYLYVLTYLFGIISLALLTEKLEANKASIHLTNAFVSSEISWAEVTAVEFLNDQGSCIIYTPTKALVYSAKRFMPNNTKFADFLKNITTQHQFPNERPSHITIPSLHFAKMRWQAVTGRGKLLQRSCEPSAPVSPQGVAIAVGFIPPV